MQEPVGQKLPEKRKLQFQEDMLMDFPDIGSLQTSFQSTEEKHLQWLHNLEERHKIQRMRLRNRHITEYQRWKEATRLSIDPEVVLPHYAATAVKEQIHETSLPVLSGQAAEDALKREGREFRHVLVSVEQLEDQGEEGEIRKNIGSAYSSVEFAAEVGRMGVNLRKTMVDEKIEMRMFQALEKEMVQNFLLKSDPEKYGKGRARMPSGANIGGASGGPNIMGMSSRPMNQTAKQGLAQSNAEIGGAGLADMFDKSKPRQPLNIKIPPPPGPRPPGPGSRTATPLTAASTATMAGDGYFPGLPSGGLMRDPRLPSKVTEPPKDPRLYSNNPSLYKNLGGGGDVTGATAGKSPTAASHPSTHTSGKPPTPSTVSFPSPFHGHPPKPPVLSPVSDPSMSSTVLPPKQMPPPPLTAGMTLVTSIPIAAVEPPTQYAAPVVPGMSPVTPAFPPLTSHQAPNAPEMTGVSPQAQAEEELSAGAEQTQGGQEMDISQG